MERLRNLAELLLVAHVDRKSTANDFLEQWIDDTGLLSNGTLIDLDALRDCIREYWERCIVPCFAKEPCNPFNLECNPDEGETLCAFLYLSKEWRGSGL